MCIAAVASACGGSGAAPVDVSSTSTTEGTSSTGAELEPPMPMTSSTSAAPEGSTSGSSTGLPAASSSESGSTQADTSTGQAADHPSDRHTPIPVGTDGAPQGYWEYLPPDFGEGEPPPLLVFLHGLGANGDGDADLDAVLETAIPGMIDADDWPADRPFVVLSPQHDGEQCVGAGEVQSFIAWAVEHYAIDASRVYLTGVSCGAFGGWRYLANVTETQIAAAVLIAGSGTSQFNEVGCDLARAPLWAFHGDNDGVVDVEGTITPISGLLNCVPTPDVQMTIYEGVGHNSWRRTYDGSEGHDVFGWMLGYPR